MNVRVCIGSQRYILMWKNVSIQVNIRIGWNFDQVTTCLHLKWLVVKYMSVKNDIGIQIYYLVISRIVCMIPTLNHGWHLLPIHMCFCLIVEKDVVIGMDVMILLKRVVHIDHTGTLQCLRGSLQDCPRDFRRDSLQENQVESFLDSLRWVYCVDLKQMLELLCSTLTILVDISFLSSHLNCNP